MTTHEARLAVAHVAAGAGRYEQHIRIGRHTVICDEPVAGGGGDAGPPPFGLLLASLGACTAMTLQMYAERKGWDVAGMRIDLVMIAGPEAARIERTITLGPTVSDEQRARLAEIAEKTPVTKAVRGGLPIATQVTTSAAPAAG